MRKRRIFFKSATHNINISGQCRTHAIKFDMCVCNVLRTYIKQKFKTYPYARLFTINLWKLDPHSHVNIPWKKIATITQYKQQQQQQINKSNIHRNTISYLIWVYDIARNKEIEIDIKVNANSVHTEIRPHQLQSILHWQWYWWRNYISNYSFDTQYIMKIHI